MEMEATGAPQNHHHTLNQQVGSITNRFYSFYYLSELSHGVLPLSEMVVAGLYLKTSTPYYLKNHLYLLKGCYE